jgi:hypothetical protein
MHCVLYVCLLRSEARTSLQARKRVCEYLAQEGFDTQLRWSGCCDYFGVGGRYSGRLSVLRLNHEQPKQLARFWKRCEKTSTAEEARLLFREMFPEFRGRPPVGREGFGQYGEPDDAQIMDEALFQRLKKGFGETVDYSYEINEPNVICTEETDDFEWPKNGDEAAKLWVVVIDYHC